MQDITHFAKCVAVHVRSVVDEWNPLDLYAALSEPESIATRLYPTFESSLAEQSIDLGPLRRAIIEQPVMHLRAIFDPGDLPPTPTFWGPVPYGAASLSAMTSIILLNRLYGMETVSYGSENNGDLFVNLVAIEGAGRIAEKSKAPMRGHTDAATFPFRGTADPRDPRIAPSPDVVFLAAMRNVDQIPTIVMPLECALARLAEEHKEVLKGPNMVFNTQGTFAQGTAQALGYEHRLDGANVLFDSPDGTWVRYSHRNTALFDEDDPVAAAAKTRFESACALCAEKIILQPGDLLIVNNRKALHGRSPVGDDVGGQSRWLIRSYGLDTRQVTDKQRHGRARYMLFP